MAKAFKRVSRYLCKWCGKEFKTDHLHDCKFDPDKRNCLSCVHQIGSDKEEGDPVTCAPDMPYFVCDKDECDGSRFCDIATLGRNNWQGKCPFHEPVPGWRGKATFKARRQAAEAAKEGGDHAKI